MIQIAVLKNEITHFNYEELEQAENIIKKEKTKRKLDEILQDTVNARKESAEGRTLVATNEKELANIFKKIIDDED
jgi:hypothetical protein